MASITTSVSHSKLVGIPGLIVGGVHDGVKSGYDTTRCLHVVGAAAIPTSVPLEVPSGLRGLESLMHLTVCCGPWWDERGQVRVGAVRAGMDVAGS